MTRMRRHAGRLRVAGGLGAALVMASTFAASAQRLPSSAGGVAEMAPAPETPGESTHGAVSGRLAVSPLLIRLELEERVTRRSRTTRAIVTITNAGTIALDSLAVVVRADSPLVVMRPAGQQTIRRLPAGAGVTLSWVICGRAAGAYRLTVSVTDNGAAVVGPSIDLSLPEATC